MIRKHQMVVASGLLFLGACGDAAVEGGRSTLQSESSTPSAVVFQASSEFCKLDSFTNVNFWKCNGPDNSGHLKVRSIDKPTASETTLSRIVGYTNYTRYEFECDSTQQPQAVLKFGGSQQGLILAGVQDGEQLNEASYRVGNKGGDQTISIKFPSNSAYVRPGCKLVIKDDVTVPDTNVMEVYLTRLKSHYEAMTSLKQLLDLHTSFSLVKTALSLAKGNLTDRILELEGRKDALTREGDAEAAADVQITINSVTDSRDNVMAAEGVFSSACPNGVVSDLAVCNSGQSEVGSICMESVCKARAAIFKAIDDVKTEVKDLEPFMSGEKARLTETHGTSAVVTAAVRDAMVRAWGVFESLYIATRQ